VTSRRQLPGGIWGFPVSPFTATGELDVEELVAGIELQISGGMDAIVVNGALAEVDALDAGEWADAASAAASFSARVPVMVALPTGEQAALAAARAAGSIAPAAMLVLPPRDGSGAALVARARAAVEVAGVPAVLYQRGAAQIEPALVEAAIDEGAVVGIKDGTRDFRALRRLMGRLDDRVTIAAAFEDMTLAYWALGVDALCPASTAHDPAYARACSTHLANGDVATARALLGAFAYPFTDLRLSRPGIDVAVVKEALRLRGHAAGRVRPPGEDLTEGERAAVAALLARLDASRSLW
jgi:5-dehydro-4-deoxyglucarate dehydratase